MTQTILLVDDNEDNLIVLEGLLLQHGYRALTARDGAESLDVAREQRPDAILMDLAMPVLNGLDATRMLKEDPTLASIPIVAVTASWLGGESEALKPAGFAAALHKPYTPVALLDTLRRVLEERAHGGEGG